jgi:DNA invertase Pin-like site-specific DNA recombinase
MMMMMQSFSPKVRPDHLDRLALVYVRQSTMIQVRENIASTARQYDLAGRARDLGWPVERIQVVDQDQGHSGASAAGRDGFQHLVAQVGLGRTGAVLSLEASRLARSCSDWYRLIEICALTNTLVIDEDGVYDPTQYSDRLLLGFLGTMSEAELHLIRSRLLGGKLKKASDGQLRFRPPTGLVYDLERRIVFDPDEQVQQAVRLVFDLFDQSPSALAVVKHFADHHLQCPTRFWGGSRHGQVIWRPLSHARVLGILHNPEYAGAYAYGRTKTRVLCLPGEEPRVKGRTRQVCPADWPFLIPGHHPGYITWNQFQQNQRRLDDNRTLSDQDRRGALREGLALLQGIVRCGRCGRRMSVRYLNNSSIPSYECNSYHTHFAGKTCQSIRGDEIDAAVARALLEAMRPAQLEVSMAAFDQIAAQARQLDRQWQLTLERARYEAELARRRFVAVEPENRLVARTLEREWNEKLAEIERMEQDATLRPQLQSRLVDPDERRRVLALAQDLSKIWYAPTTHQTARKQLLGYLIKDVTLCRGETTIQVAIRWQTEACTALEVPRPKRSYEMRRTDPVVVAKIKVLALEHTDSQIASLLDQEGFRSGTGSRFTRHIVSQLRYSYSIISGCPEAPAACAVGLRADGRCSAKTAGEMLNVNVSTIADWCQSGTLDGIQSAPYAPWWIKLTPENIADLRKPTRRAWSRQSVSREK